MSRVFSRPDKRALGKGAIDRVGAYSLPAELVSAYWKLMPWFIRPKGGLDGYRLRSCE